MKNKIDVVKKYLVLNKKKRLVSEAFPFENIFYLSFYQRRFPVFNRMENSK